MVSSEGRSNHKANYTLSNGRIVKDLVSGDTFTYDKDGYISSAGDWTVTWSNGNPIKYKNDTEEITFSYSNITYPAGFIDDFEFEYIYDDVVLMPQGFYGKLPKNLPSKCTRSDGSWNQYEYTVENGLVTKITVKDQNGNVDVVSLEWK